MEHFGGAIGRTAVFARARMGEKAQKKLFTDLWNHFYPRLCVFSARILSDNADVEDAVQEVMLKVYRNLPRYRPDYAVGTWIYTIARNHCLDRIRSATASPAIIGALDSDTFASRYPTPEESYVQVEGVREVTDQIRRLSPTDMQISFLHFYESLPYRKVSSILDIPVGTIKYRVHRIRKTLACGVKEDM